jgi:hypothetical protein
MAKYEQALPRWVRDAVLGYVRGYEELLAWRESERQYILLGRRSGAPEIVGGGCGAARPVEQKAERLLALGQEPNGRILAAIEQALAAVGADVADDGLRLRLRGALLANCGCGRNYPYGSFDLAGISYRSFYRRRAIFLHKVAVLAGLIIDSNNGGLKIPEAAPISEARPFSG